MPADGKAHILRAYFSNNKKNEHHEKKKSIFKSVTNILNDLFT